MQLPLTILSVLLVLGTVGVLLYDLQTKKYDFLSMRNIFLLGLAHFFGIGTYFTATSGFGTDLYVAGEKGIKLLFLCTIIFLIVFVVTQRLAQNWSGLRRIIPGVQLPITQQGINLAIIALLFGAFLGAVLPNVGYVAALYSQFRGGMASAAVALATYNLLARKFSPIAWGVFFATLGTATLLSTVGDIGRRSLLGVVLAIGWMWYYYSLRYRPSGPTMIKIGTLMIVGFFGLVVYAGFRGEGEGAGVGKGGFSLETRINQFTQAITNPTFRADDLRSSIMSDAPTNSMFIMENYPDTYDYDYFNGIKFIVANPIPRFLWQEKPKGLGIAVQQQLQSPANLGVGIMGHGWAEGGWIGVAGYAAFFGVLLAGLDNLIRQRMWNPYFLAAIGSSLGNVYALARGETSLFLLQVINHFVGVILVLYLLKLVAKPIMAASQPLIADGNRWAFESDEDEVSDDDGYEGEGVPEEEYATADWHEARADIAGTTRRSFDLDQNEAA
jgi:hypothetical protein